jgi:tetratricopeptide (TPR) repeat protein
MNNKINTEKKKNILPFKQPAAFYYKKAKQANNNNRVLDALVFYRKASELEPDNFDYISGMADIYTELEFFEESNAIIYEAMRNNPRLADDCSFIMGCNFMGLSYLNNADKCFKRYLSDNPKGEYAEEIESFFDFINNESDLSDLGLVTSDEVYDYARISKARKFIANNDEDKSIDIYNEILDDDPKNTVVLNDLSLAYYAKGEINKAIDSAEAVLSIDFENITAISNLIIFYKSLGDEFSVNKFISELQETDISSPDDLQKAAFILTWIGMYNEAYECILDLLELNPHDIIILHSAGVAAYNLKKHNEAISYWESIIKIVPTNTIAQYFIEETNKAIDGKRDNKLEYLFELPEEEIKNRHDYLERMFKFSDKETFERWKNSKRFYDLIIWALDSAKLDFRLKIIDLLSSFDDEKSKKILYRQLLKPKIRPLFKKKIIETLCENGEKEPFFADIDGKVEEYYKDSDIKDSELLFGEFQDMFLMVVGYFNKIGNQDLTDEFFMIYSLFSERGGLNELNPKHKKHIAAAFVYLSAKRGGNNISMERVCADFKVSIDIVRKSRRVLEKLLENRT